MSPRVLLSTLALGVALGAAGCTTTPVVRPTTESAPTFATLRLTFDT
jgi:hypothetical protein